jgi:hypothetical protein
MPVQIIAITRAFSASVGRPVANCRKLRGQ